MTDIVEKSNGTEAITLGMSATIAVEEHARAGDNFSTSGPGVSEKILAVGEYHLECHGPDGVTLWEEDIKNVSCNIGANLILNSAFAASSLTTTGPFMMLISSASFSAVAAADTMASHAGWLEAGNANAPTYTAPRPTVSFNAASSRTIASSGTITFAITGTGTIQGIGMTMGSGAVSTIDNTSGTLVSAGTLAAAQPVINTNTVTATYKFAI